MNFQLVSLSVVFLCRGASVCSGGCHPDAILRQEQCKKANKLAYYSELHQYHTKYVSLYPSSCNIVFPYDFYVFILLIAISFVVWQNDRDPAIVEGNMGQLRISRK